MGEGSSRPGEDEERAAFRVGGVARRLSKEEELAQLGSYIDAHHPAPSEPTPWVDGAGDSEIARRRDERDRWAGHLPDRLTHAAMLQLGSGRDHAMPGVAYGRDVAAEDIPGIGTLLTPPPDAPSSRSRGAAVALGPGGLWAGRAQDREHNWLPELAALAARSGVAILDVAYPRAPEHSLADMSEAVREGLARARELAGGKPTLVGFSAGAALAALHAEEAGALLLINPDLEALARLPEELRGDAALPEVSRWPETLVQLATEDEVADHPTGLPEGATVQRFVARHRIATPAEARRRARAGAAFLTGGDMAAALAEEPEEPLEQGG
ncbi:alpha/beta hydrolase fold domain-containing protein [Corynebacterium otitidis]|uniref:Alpha/beta hydrolase fold-3 domain-containing protein n=1 Tax=Corynebacterium otitidis ATCC 51513 TaxID=883169 RepID=I7L9S9_9CORY|nr:alpha/beta hydrolase fold domain-containing protein [Corynebacterium otitidis]EJZ81361.1 hypothetical protein HMPREF9719_01704 [Corynebacterium otitidis ATCC 51513]CCI84032.1 hypothetical protein BN46_1310 [Corynebacterium otitidis ATCC 51513]